MFDQILKNISQNYDLIEYSDEIVNECKRIVEIKPSFLRYKNLILIIITYQYIANKYEYPLNLMEFINSIDSTWNFNQINKIFMEIKSMINIEYKFYGFNDYLKIFDKYLISIKEIPQLREAIIHLSSLNTKLKVAIYITLLIKFNHQYPLLNSLYLMIDKELHIKYYSIKRVLQKYHKVFDRVFEISREKTLLLEK